MSAVSAPFAKMSRLAFHKAEREDDVLADFVRRFAEVFYSARSDSTGPASCRSARWSTPRDFRSCLPTGVRNR